MEKRAEKETGKAGQRERFSCGKEPGREGQEGTGRNPEAAGASGMYEAAKKYEEEAVAFRRDLHAHPELSNQERRTTGKIREKLEAYGIAILDAGLSTGIAAEIYGTKAGTGKEGGKGTGADGETGKDGKRERVIALREDIDALPIEERTGLPFASENQGVCHACGHDIHTAVLVLCARLLAEHREEFSGTVRLLFQPAEEKGSGAKEMIRLGLMDRPKPDLVLGCHVSPEIPAGKIGFRRGPANASSDTLFVKIFGKGGHGAHPDNCVDPILTAAYLLTQLQTVVSRENPPVYPAVLTFGSIHAGTAPNVIPEYAELQGSLRSLNEESRRKMQESIERITENCCCAMRARAELRWDMGMPPLVNSIDVMNRLDEAVRKTLGEEGIHEIENPSTGSDDFSYLLDIAPGAQFRLGTGNGAPESNLGLHNGGNVFDERAIVTGASVMAQFVLDYLSE